MIAAAALLSGVTDPRAPKADITNARYLMGDVYQGDASEFPYGDASEAPYGDVSTAGLDIWDTLIGDVEDDDSEIGALKLGPKGKKIAKIAGLSLAGGGLTYAAIKALQKRRQQKLAVRRAEATNAKSSTIANQIRARRMMGKLDPNQLMPFYQIAGATLNAYPLAPTEYFPAASLRYNMDRQASDTPFESEIVQGVYSGSTWTTTTVGTTAPRYYCAVFLGVGINMFNGNPGTIFQVTGTFPTVNGTLVVASAPWAFTMMKGFYARFLIYPWQLVVNKPILALGSYTTALPIIVNVTGIPSTGNTTLVVPGSLHSWTIAMRNSMA